jgi:hypothetical protein
MIKCVNLESIAPARELRPDFVKVEYKDRRDRSRRLVSSEFGTECVSVRVKESESMRKEGAWRRCFRVGAIIKWRIGQLQP